MTKEIIIDGCNVAECEYADLKSLPIDCPINNGFCYEFNCYFKQLQRLKQENEELIAQLSCFYRKKEYIKLLKYRQALEEIRKEANRLLYEENPIYGYNNSNYFEILAKYVLAKIKEVSNEQK